MKKHLLKSLLALALVLISGSVWADTATITFADLNLENSVQYSDPFDGGDFTVTFAGGANDGKYYNTGSGIRVYGGGTMTIDAEDAGKVITAITITYDGSYKPTTDDVVNVGTYTNSTGTWAGSAASVVFTRPSGSGHWRVQSISATIEDPDDNSVETTITIDDSGITNTDVYTNTEAGSFSATVAAGKTTISGATVTWSSSKEEVATINETTGAVTLVAAGKTVITASYAGVADEYKSSSATYELTVTNSDPNLPGAVNNPYSVAQARAAIDANGTIADAYATGYIYQIDSYNSNYHSITYWISDDGTDSNPLEVYGGLAKEGEEFSSMDDLVIGAKVVVKGELKKYGSTYEFNSNNQLVSIVYPVATPTFTPVEGTYEQAQSVTINCATNDATIYYTLDGTDPTNTSSVFSEPINITENTTVKAFAAKADYLDSKIATAVFTISAIVLPTSVTVVPASAEVMFGESTTLTATVLPADATNKDVTWESSDPTVATVSTVGVVSALKEGTATITATSVADGTKKGTCTITVIKPDYDLFNNEIIGVTGTSYVEWENAVEGTYTGISYEGQSAGGNSSIQLRSNNSNSGIVTTSFYGRATKIVVEWNSNTSNGRTLDIYGKSTAYSAATDLYGDNKGDKLGSIVCGTSTELEIAADATSDYIGLRSSSGAMYIDKIKIYWELKTKTVTVSPYEWATASFSDRVIVPSNGTVYKVSGATDGALDLVEVPVGGVIGKQVGVLLYKAGGGDLDFVITGNNATVLGTDTDNKLSATGDISTSDYILGTYEGGFGFCHPSENMTCTSGKAFLPASAVTGSEAPFLRIGGTTNIANVKSAAEAGVYYDLMGRKVEQPQRGIYIVNGKKVLVK